MNRPKSGSCMRACGYTRPVGSSWCASVNWKDLLPVTAYCFPEGSQSALKTLAET